MAKTKAANKRGLADLGGSLVGLATGRRGASRDLAHDLARDFYGLHGGLEALHGERNENYRARGDDGREIILKLSGAADDLGGIGLQIAALDHIARFAPDLPVPRVIRTRDGRAWTDRDGLRIFAVSALPGEPVADHDRWVDLLGPLATHMGKISRALRGFRHGWAPDRLVWDLRSAPRLAPAAVLIRDRGIRSTVEGIFASFVACVVPRFDGYRGQFLHNDGNTPNVLADGTPLAISGVVDFGDMTFGPMVVDIAVGCADNTPPGITALPTILKQLAAFSAERPLEDDELELLYDCILARMAVGVTVQEWRVAHDPAGVDLLADWTEITARALDELLTAGRARVLAAMRSAAHHVAPLPNRGAVPAIDGLVKRRHKVLGRDLSLTYKQPLHIVRGDGVWLYDATGRAYLDAYNNVPQVGHAHPAVVEAIARQAATLNTNTRYLHETVLEFSERLTATLPDGMEVCAFVNSGSEANDIAWRMARAWTGNGGGLVMENAYHGITEAVAALSPYEASGNAMAPHVRTLKAPDSYRRRGDDDAPDADRAIADLAVAGYKPALFMVDSGLTSNGVPDVRDGYLADIVGRVRAAGGLIVGDEVQFGFARAGKAFWGFGAHGIVPDIVTMGKPIGNGHPLGVVVTRREILDHFMKVTDFFSTFGGNPVSAAAGLAVLDVIEREELQRNALQTGAYFRGGLTELIERHRIIGDVRGTGLLLAVEIVRDRASKEPDRGLTDRVKNRMRELGVLVGTEGINGNILKVRPPLPFRPEHADLAVSVLDRAVADVEAA